MAEKTLIAIFCLVRLRTFRWIFSILILLRFGGARPTRLRVSVSLTVTQVRDPRAFDLLWIVFVVFLLIRNCRIVGWRRPLVGIP